MDEGQALFEYSRQGKLEEVQAELAEGESPNAYMGYDGRTALMAAARNGHCAVVLALLGARADLTPRSEEGSDALLHAAAGGSAEVVKALLAARAEVVENEEGLTALQLARHYGHLAAAEILEGLSAAEKPVEGGGSKAAVLAGEHFAYECLEDAELAEAALRQYGEAQKLRPKPPSEVGRCARCARREGRQNGCCVA
ncbi:unnamed protein product [Effrenium voratum]|nr:unnamed protein product [Effrenium voratum]